MKIFGRIYKITNLTNGQLYIGQTIKTVEYRFSQHKRRMDCPKLRNAFLKYGIENFIAEELDVALSKEELNKKEIEWIGNLESIKNGYNIDLGGTIRHPDIGKKISMALLGKKFTEERKNKLSAQRIGRKVNNYNRSPETIIKKRLNHTKSKKIIDQNGRIYLSIHEAAEKTKVDYRIISAILNGKSIQYKGWVFSVDLSKNPIPRDKRGSIKIIDNNGNLYNSISEASLKLNIDNSTISKVIYGKLKSTGGYTFSKRIETIPILPDKIMSKKR